MLNNVGAGGTDTAGGAAAGGGNKTTNGTAGADYAYAGG